MLTDLGDCIHFPQIDSAFAGSYLYLYLISSLIDFRYSAGTLAVYI